MEADNDVAFKTLEDCLDVINSYKDADEIKAADDFHKHLQIISVHHTKNGLHEDHLELLSSFVYKKHLKSKSMSHVIQCMIPVHTVPECIVSKVVQYVLSYCFELQSTVTVSILKWLLSLLEYELMEDVNAIDKFYRAFYFMLKHDNYEIRKYAIRIIFMLTRPEDVTEDKVSFLTESQAKYGNSKDAKALFSLFKSYQPSQVPASTTSMDTIEVPNYLPSNAMKNALIEAQRRNSEDFADDNNTESNRKPSIKLFKEFSVKPKFSDNITNVPNYRNWEKSRKKITEIQSVVEVEEGWNCIQLPSNLLCLLATDPGVHYLAFGDEALQYQFAFKLNDTLNKLFIRRTLYASNREKKEFLERLFAFQDYMKQGVSVISRYLVVYLKSWNSVDFQKQIFSLVEWVTFSSYEELENKILLPLYDILVTGCVDTACDIITALTKLLINMFQVDFYRSQRGIKPLFLGIVPGWILNDAVDTLSRTSKAIGHFIISAFLIDPNSSKLLHKAIQFYETFFSLEMRCDLGVVSIIPFNIVYRSLFSLNATSFNRVCRLLNSYPTIINRIIMNNSVRNFENELNLIDRYNTDIINCLWRKQAISNSANGLIFRNFENCLSTLNRIGDADSAFSLEKNVLFSMYVFPVADICSDSISELFKPENLVKLVDTFLPDVSVLIKKKLSEDEHYLQ